MSRHRYLPGPALVKGVTGTIKVAHTPACSCGWTASAPYAAKEFAYAAWTAHVDSEGNSA